MIKNIFVACDVSSQKEILDLLELIHEDIAGIKIGLQYITQRSPEEIKELSKFNKPIFYDGNPIGEITSGMYGHYLDKSLGMGYINFENKDKLEEMLKVQKFEIEIAGFKYKADASLAAFYDSKRKKILI